MDKMGNQFGTKFKLASMGKDNWSHLRFWAICMTATLSIHFIDFLAANPAIALPLSPGDRIRILIPEGELFSGVYEVNIDGNIQVPYLDPLPVKGLEIAEVKQKIYHTLIDRNFFQPKFLQVNVSILQWASIQVSVSGAIFQAGRVSINNRSAEERNLQQNQLSGDNPPERYLTAALRGAGGVTPMANVKEIRVIRNGLERIVDLAGIFTGEEIEDVALIAGDRVIVPELPQQQNSLVRPSQITPTGIRVFLSNLTTPAPGSVKSDGTGFPYGARFSQAVISANCVGGISSTNASRRAVLVRTDRQTGATKVFERDVEQIIRSSTDDINNPFLMPEDSVGCYDSTVNDVRDVVRTITDVLLNPFNLLFK